MNVQKTTPTAFVYNELGKFPLIIERKLRILKYWLKIVNSDDNNLTKIVYKNLLLDATSQTKCENWVSLVKNLLETNGFGFVWRNQGVDNINLFLAQFKQRLQDCFIQKNDEEINNVSENRLYKYIKGSFVFKDYLSKITDKHLRISLSKIRLGSHNFMNERGRWHLPKLPYSERLCNLCNEVEDEYHILLLCPRYKKFRSNIFIKRLLIKPSMHKFIYSLQNIKESELKSFALFCFQILKEYQSFIL